MLRQILYAEKEGNQPFLIAGSGTMGWDAVGANLVESGDEALVLNTGYFGDAFADWYVLLLSYVDGWWKDQRVRVELDERVGRAERLRVGEGERSRIELMIVSKPTELKLPRSKPRSEVFQRTSHLLSQKSRILI
jgi:hypothetical protein